MRITLSLGIALSAIPVLAQSPIDSWEPVKKGAILPSAVASAPTSANTWIGYSNGDLFWGSNGSWLQVNFPNYYTYDTIRPGIVTSIAAGKTSASSDNALVSYATQSPLATFQLWSSAILNGRPSLVDLTSKVPATALYGVSKNPLNEQLNYLATDKGAFAGFNGTWSFIKKQPTDPLKVPTGSAISTVARRPDADQILVGTETGEVWLVFGAISGTPSWTRIDNGPYVILPKFLVTKIDIDSRDVSGKTFAVSFNTSGNAAWITRNGGQSWTAVDQGPYTKGPATVRNVTFARVAGATTLYGYAFGAYGFPYPVRSDDNGKSWFATTRWSGQNMSVEYRHTDNAPFGNQLAPVVRVRNLGSTVVPLKNAYFEYKFTPEGTASPSYVCDYSSYGCSNVKGVFPFAYKLQIQLNTLVNVGPGQVSSDIQGRVAKADWSNYDQTNDASYIAAATAFTVNHQILFYNNGQYLWGNP